VYAVAWHPDGSLVATGGADRMIRVWDASTGRLLRTMTGHTELVYSLDFSPDGQRLVSASTDQTVRLWVPATGDATLTLPFASQVYGAQFTRDGRRLAVLPMDDTVVMLDGSSKR
jgi:WD40 repeat protein